MNPSEILKSDLMKWTTEVENIAKDALREIEKLLEAIAAADRHFVAEGAMNAALHLSEKVLPNPLAAKVGGALSDGAIALQRLQKRMSGEKELPFGDN
jgi:hypothetical protein